MKWFPMMSHNGPSWTRRSLIWRMAEDAAREAREKADRLEIIACNERMRSSAQETLDRTVLPIQEPARPTYSELDARTVKAPSRFEVKTPAGAPNVVIVLIDDNGFGGPSTFGGPIRTPTMHQLAQAGLPCVRRD